MNTFFEYLCEVCEFNSDFFCIVYEDAFVRPISPILVWVLQAWTFYCQATIAMEFTNNVSFSEKIE